MKARSGSIINMSSVIGEMGNAGQSSYAASKAGILGFTKSIAKELGSRNIRCNAIAPGFVETDMTSYLKEGEAADKYKADSRQYGQLCYRPGYKCLWRIKYLILFKKINTAQH